MVCSPHSVHKAHAGESEKILREAFFEALSHAKSGKPSVIFIDEIDVLCPRRNSRYVWLYLYFIMFFIMWFAAVNEPEYRKIPRRYVETDYKIFCVS